MGQKVYAHVPWWQTVFCLLEFLEAVGCLFVACCGFCLFLFGIPGKLFGEVLGEKNADKPRGRGTTRKRTGRDDSHRLK